MQTILYHGTVIPGLDTIKANAKSHATGKPVAYFRYSEIDPSEQKMHANHIRDHILEEGTEMAQFYHAHFSSLWESKDS